MCNTGPGPRVGTGGLSDKGNAVAMAKHDDEFLEFASARTSHLFRTAYLMSGDWHQAEDLVQETLGKVYAVWGRKRRIENPDAYAQTVLTRTFISARRKRSSREMPSSQIPEREFHEADTTLRMTLLAGLAELPAKDRAVLVLRFWEDRSVEEVAHIMGASSGAVRTRTNRALTRLRGTLGDRLPDLAVV